MKSGVNLLLLILSAILLFFYEMVEMFPAADGTAVGGSYVTTIPFFLFFLYLLLYIQGYRYIRRFRLLSCFVAVICGIYFSSLLCGGITSAFQAKFQYVSVILPVITLWGISGHGSSYFYSILDGICVLFVALACYFFSNYSLHILDELESQNNGAYTLLYFLPFILCLKKNAFRIGGMVIILAALLLSLKRGGLLAFALAVLVYWVIYNITNKKKFGFGALLLSVLVIGGFVFIYLYFDEMTGNILSTRFLSLQDDGGSGRLDTYPVVWSNIKDSSFINLVFGHGWNAVKMQCGMDRSAHNDFLEILFDFGIIVTTFYVIFIVEFFSVTRKLIKKHSFYAAPFGSTYVLFLSNSMVSHVIYYPKYGVLFALFFGLLSIPIYYELKNNKQGNESNACVRNAAGGHQNVPAGQGVPEVSGGV